MASTRRSRSHAPRVDGVATGPATCSNTSASTVGPSRLRAWVIPAAVGTDHPASQHLQSLSLQTVAAAVGGDVDADDGPGAAREDVPVNNSWARVHLHGT